MRKSAVLGLLAWLCCATAALATMPASREEIVCGYPTLVTGTIVGAQSRDCRLKAPGDPYCDRRVEISLAVDGVLKGAHPLRSAEILQAYARFSNALPMTVGTSTIPMNHLWGVFSFPATGKPLGSDEARRTLTGTRIIFGYVTPRPAPHTGNLALPIDSLEWVRSVIRDPRCDKPSGPWRLRDGS